MRYEFHLTSSVQKSSIRVRSNLKSCQAHAVTSRLQRSGNDMLYKRPPSDRGRTAVGPPSDRRRTAVRPPSDRGRTAVGPPSDRGRTAVGPRSDRRRTAVGPRSSYKCRMTALSGQIGHCPKYNAVTSWLQRSVSHRNINPK